MGPWGRYGELKRFSSHECPGPFLAPVLGVKRGAPGTFWILADKVIGAVKIQEIRGAAPEVVFSSKKTCAQVVQEWCQGFGLSSGHVGKV